MTFTLGGLSELFEGALSKSGLYPGYGGTSRTFTVLRDSCPAGHFYRLTPKCSHFYPTPTLCPASSSNEQARGRRRTLYGSGRRPGRVRWGRPLLSPPRGEFCSGDAAVQLAADSVVARSCGRPGVLMGLDGCDLVTFFSCVIRVPVCPCTPVCPVCCPGSPRSLFTGGAKTGPFRDETYPTGNTLPAGRD